MLVFRYLSKLVESCLNPCLSCIAMEAILIKFLVLLIGLMRNSERNPSSSRGMNILGLFLFDDGVLSVMKQEASSSPLDPLKQIYQIYLSQLLFLVPLFPFFLLQPVTIMIGRNSQDAGGSDPVWFSIASDIWRIFCHFLLAVC